MMTPIQSLPENVIRVIEGAPFTEYATVSAAAVPINTPTYVFPSDDLGVLALATGLAYPAKAERARRNPRVGLLLEGGANEPVVSIRGRAAVRDADLANNARRYISETGFEGISYGLSWREARKAVWYWTRVIVEVTPQLIMWWDNPAAMDEAPNVWIAPDGFVFPQSDPAPVGKPSAAPSWPQRPWQEIAQDGLGRGVLPHLTLCDDDGYPLPIRLRSCELVGDRFKLRLPRWTPWSLQGKAHLSYIGLECFVGDLDVEGDNVWFKVERALPQLPSMMDPKLVLSPTEDLRQTFMTRLTEEVARRSQSIPTLPEEVPTPTRLARHRFAKFGSGAKAEGSN